MPRGVVKVLTSLQLCEVPPEPPSRRRRGSRLALHLALTQDPSPLVEQSALRVHPGAHLLAGVACTMSHCRSHTMTPVAPHRESSDLSTGGLTAARLTTARLTTLTPLP